MEGLFSKNRIGFIHRELHLLLTSSRTLLSFENKQYTLPDASYGEWIFYRNAEPAYYYCSFDSQGRSKPLVKDAERLGMEIDKYIIKGLKNIFDIEVVAHPKDTLFKFSLETKVVSYVIQEIIETN